MSPRFAVEARAAAFEGLEDVAVVFQGINKSGSLAMSRVIGEALAHEGRRRDFLCHYTMRGVNLEEFRDMVAAARGRAFAVGHGLYGAIPPAPRRIWVTQLRHPLPRLISVHQWLRREHERAHGSAEGFPDLAAAVRAWGGRAHSQVGQFGRSFGRHGGPRPGPARLSLRDTLEISKAALEREVYWIGIAERFEESIFGFAALCGLGTVAPWERDTRNAGRPLVTEVEPAVLDLIRETYWADFELYDWALRRFEEQNARVAFGPALAAYQEACRDEYKDRILTDAAGEAVVTLGRPEAEADVPARRALTAGLDRARAAARRWAP